MTDLNNVIAVLVVVVMIVSPLIVCGLGGLIVGYLIGRRRGPVLCRSCRGAHGTYAVCRPCFFDRAAK